MSSARSRDLDLLRRALDEIRLLSRHGACYSDDMCSCGAGGLINEIKGRLATAGRMREARQRRERAKVREAIALARRTRSKP